jgi:hypothetical protein
MGRKSIIELKFRLIASLALGIKGGGITLPTISIYGKKKITNSNYLTMPASFSKRFKY